MALAAVGSSPFTKRWAYTVLTLLGLSVGVYFVPTRESDAQVYGWYTLTSVRDSYHTPDSSKVTRCYWGLLGDTYQQIGVFPWSPPPVYTKFPGHVTNWYWGNSGGGTIRWQEDNSSQWKYFGQVYDRVAPAYLGDWPNLPPDSFPGIESGAIQHRRAWCFLTTP